MTFAHSGAGANSDLRSMAACQAMVIQICTSALAVAVPDFSTYTERYQRSSLTAIATFNDLFLVARHCQYRGLMLMALRSLLGTRVVVVMVMRVLGLDGHSRARWVGLEPM